MPASSAAPSVGRRVHADLDPDNDQEVGPPAAVSDCAERLRSAGVVFTPAQLPLRPGPRGIPSCGAHDAVLYRRGPTGVRYQPEALVTCKLALALVDLEHLFQEQAERVLGARVTSLRQGGTFNCRKMARFKLASEHSFGNAIDVRSFKLTDGRSVELLTHFGKLDAHPTDARAIFLRSVGELAYDRGIVSVSLGPYWDTLHRDHFHFDMARYRVDGSRP